LLIVNLKPIYDSALKGDLTYFEKFKTQIQQELGHRNNKSVTIVADCADNLFQNQYIDQSELVESWWHRVYLEWIQQEQNIQLQNDITIVCPHLGQLLCKDPFKQHNYKIFDNHNHTIDIACNIIMAPPRSVKRLEQVQLAEPTGCTMETKTYILVAEPEADLQYIYSMWLHSRGFKNILISDSGRRCLENLVKIQNKTRRSNVIFILDSHLKDISFIEIVKQISNRKPDAQIILTTTSPSDIIDSMKIDTNNSKVLLKPFSLSDLLSLIGNSSRDQQRKHP